MQTIELDETMLMANATHTCRATVQAIADAAGHYLMIVKGDAGPDWPTR